MPNKKAILECQAAILNNAIHYQLVERAVPSPNKQDVLNMLNKGATAVALLFLSAESFKPVAAIFTGPEVWDKVIAAAKAQLEG